MELDHVFVFADRNGEWPLLLSHLGLVETYRRKHPGQGTSNACYCFENAFLEVIWVDDLHDTRTEAIRRCGFDVRSQWLANRDANPFGIAWRRTADVETWAFRPPYLPQDKAILVSCDSDDLRQPFMFSFPGTTAPKTWQEERRRSLQSASGFERLTIESVTLGDGLEPSRTLMLLHQSGCIEKLSVGREHAMVLRFDGPLQTPTCRITLPDFNTL